MAEKLNDMQVLANSVAAKGRYGDDQLVHMNRYEVDALNKHFNGTMTLNPETGQPEMFFPFLAAMLPALAGAGAAAAPFAAAAAPLAATTAAAAAPLAATALPAAAAASLPTMLTGSTLAAAPAALTSAAPSAALMSGAPLGASALPSFVPPASSALLPSIAPSINPALATAPTLAPHIATAPAAAAAPTAAEMSTIGAEIGSMASPTPAALPTAAEMSALGSEMGALASPTPAQGALPTTGRLAAPGLGRPPPELLSAFRPPVPSPTPPPIAPPIPPMGAPPMGVPPMGVPPIAPAGAAPAGAAPAAPGGKGLGDLLSMKNILPAAMLGSVLMPSGGGGAPEKKDREKVELPERDPALDIVELPGAGYRPGIDPEFEYFPYRYAQGGMVNIPFDVNVGEPSVTEKNESAFGEMGQPSGLMGAPVFGAQPSTGYGAVPGGNDFMQQFQQGGAVIGQPDPRIQLIDAAEQALMGNHPEPEKAIKDFVDAFGESAFERLKQAIMAKIQGDEPRMVRGPGGPKEDKIPARINGVEEARLSDSEVVIPADAVAGAGGGDSDAGAARLMQMSQQLAGKPPLSEMPVEKVKG